MGGCTRVLEHCKRKSIHHTTSALTYGIVSHVSKLGEGASSLPVPLYPSYLEMDLLQRRDRGLVISNLGVLQLAAQESAERGPDSVTGLCCVLRKYGHGVQC